MRTVGSGRAWVGFGFLVAIFEIFVADNSLPRGATAATIYIVLFVVIARSSDRKSTYALAGLITALVATSYFYKPTSPDPWKALFDRSVVIASVWFIALAIPWHHEKVMRVVGSAQLTDEERAALAASWDADASDEQPLSPSPSRSE